MATEHCVDKDMVIGEVLRLHPRTLSVFVKHGMACTGCMGALDETLEGGAKMHGLNADRLLEELNAVVAREEGVA